MKKTLNRALLKKAQASREDDASNQSDAAPKEDAQPVHEAKIPDVSRVGGAGSAWKAGAAEQNKAALIQARDALVTDILTGSHELLLEPNQVFDRLGTDRRDDWMDQDAIIALRTSIENDGQDTPIHVWPTDPSWTPDKLDPTNVDGIEFDLITGRRRHAVCGMMGKRIRAILANPVKRGAVEEQFEMLFMRFRENEERENLGPFERLCSIGEMFEELLENHSGKKPTAVSFASRINVHESIVSRGRAVFKARDKILNKFKNAYDLSYPELQKALSSLTTAPPKTTAAKAKPSKVSIQKKVGTRKLSLTAQSGKLSINTTGLTLDKGELNELGDMIAEHLNKIRSE